MGGGELGPDDWAQRIRGGDRAALARAITLIESVHPSHRARARDLLAALGPVPEGTHRIGVTGAPGVGKSTFIDGLGATLIAGGHRVAVLAIDPSSVRTGGSILGDKTRMVRLGRAPEAFIRPSPTGGMLGGVARRTRETLLLCEAAGFDRILVETVGVGQSEIAVADVVDTVVVLMIPGAGDGLQGIKRGILEAADLVVVNKADGDRVAAAGQAHRELVQALALGRGRQEGWVSRALLCSAQTGEGLSEVVGALDAHREALEATGAWERARGDQREAWMVAEITAAILEALGDDGALDGLRDQLMAEVRAGEVVPEVAARRLIQEFRRGSGSSPGPATTGAG